MYTGYLVFSLHGANVFVVWYYYRCGLVVVYGEGVAFDVAEADAQVGGGKVRNALPALDVDPQSIDAGPRDETGCGQHILGVR